MLPKRKTYSCDIKFKVFQAREAEGRIFQSGKDFAEVFKDITKLDLETFFVATLNQKNREIDRHLISVGTLTASLVHPREVFRPVINDAAAAVAFIHNHPSGDPTPSPEDKSLTTRLCEAAKLLGIRVLDHVIVGINGSYSFVDHGLLP